MKDFDFVKERDEALLSLDKEKIEAFFRKNTGCEVPANDLVFWAGVHKAILYLNSATFEQKMRSCDWLIEHGFSPVIKP